MKRVSSKITKVLKDAGYPLERFQTVSREQFEAGHGYKYSTDKNYYSESPSILYPEDNDAIDMYDCPFCFDAWLWLWKTKKICLEIEKAHTHDLYIQRDCVCGTEQCGGFYTQEFADPEEAIIAAIEYLCDNDLIM